MKIERMIEIMKFRLDLKIFIFILLFYFTKQLNLYIISLTFALIHELCHIIVGILLGFKLNYVEMMPFGLFASIKPLYEDYRIINMDETEIFLEMGFNTTIDFRDKKI